MPPAAADLAGSGNKRACSGGPAGFWSAGIIVAVLRALSRAWDSGLVGSEKVVGPTPAVFTLAFCARLLTSAEGLPLTG